MKFKKVEISAFRIYDKVEEGTFDFTLGNEIADFVAIYAPNGFGKTSFYDAVEWGVTNNIHRFWQTPKITEKSLEALKDVSAEQIKLWRNTSSTSNTFVKILTDSSRTFTRELNVHGNSNADITDEDIVENKEFRQVILSQEWISAFLKEVNGERRYETFMENPDLREINLYYSNLKSVLNLSLDRITTTRQSIATKQQELITTIEGNTLQAINDQIAKLNRDYNAGLSALSLASTQEDIIDFKNIVSTRIVEVASLIEALQNKLEYVGLARSGGNNVISIQQYVDVSKQSLILGKDIETIRENLDRFEEVAALVKNRTTLNSSLQAKLNDSESFNSIISNFQTFIENSSTIASYQSQITAKQREVAEIDRDHDGLRQSQESLKEKHSTVVKQISETENKIRRLPEIAQQLETLTKQIETGRQSISNSLFSIETFRTEAAELESALKKHQELIEQLEVGQLEDQMLIQDPAIKTSHENLISARLSVNTITRSIETLDQKIDQQEELNTAIQQFVKEGHDLVNKTNTSTCPLCEHQYNTFDELAARISNNKALTSALQDLFQEKQALHNSLNLQLAVVESETRLLVDFYSKIIRGLNANLTTTQEQLGQEETRQSDHNNALSVVENRLHEVNTEIDGLPIGDYEQFLNESLSRLYVERDFYLKDLQEIQQKINSNLDEKKINSSSSQYLTRQVDRLRSDSKFITVNEWLKQNGLEEDPSVTKLQERLALLSTDIARISNSIEEVTKEIDQKGVQLAQATVDQLRSDLEKKLETLELMQSRLLAFEYYLVNQLNEKVNADNAATTLDRVEQELRGNLASSKLSLDEYNVLERYRENVFPYLKSERAKQEINELEAQLKFMVENVHPAIFQEKEKTREHLERRVQDFFYTDLINKIYNKIDPHPDYKSVEFKVDFDADAPRLDIFVVNNREEGKLIPNLYFSTAQINILSLSIFLASALNSSTYKSIFIDDPIQSMDSINVLSTIDLIRSIVVNERRQIILSTHDSNFYNLLKKKIPFPQYQSRFIELETFGKVKSDNLVP